MKISYMIEAQIIVKFGRVLVNPNSYYAY